MIVDASALIAILRGEPEGDAFRAILERQTDAHISAGSLVEARVIAISLNIAGELDELISELGIRIISVDEQQAQAAAQGFAKFGKGRHPAGLNFGDLFAYALAKNSDEPLLFKGDDFSKTDVKRVL